MLICWLERSINAIRVDEKESPWNIPWLICKLLHLILPESCLRFKIVFHFCILTFRELIKIRKLFSYTIMQDQKDIFYSQFIHCWHSYYSEQQFSSNILLVSNWSFQLQETLQQPFLQGQCISFKEFIHSFTLSAVYYKLHNW